MSLTRWILILVFAGACFGQEEEATVRLYGRSLFRVAATPDTDAVARARQIERRLNRIVESNSIGNVRISRGAGAERVIEIGNIPVVTVTAADAEENVADVDTLARTWEAEIRSAISRLPNQPPSTWGVFTLRVSSAFRSAFSRLSESAIEIVPGALAALLVLGLFWLAAGLMRRVLRVFVTRFVKDQTAGSLINQGTYYSVVVLGVFVAAAALGFEPENVVAGLGLTSLALGFALKDILSNFVSGILLLVLRPFTLGDQIVVGATEGDVERIELRATQIRTYDGRIVYVPNAEIFSSRVTNNTATPLRRASVRFPLGYDQDLRLTVRTMAEAAGKVPGVLPDRPIAVWIQELNSENIAIEVFFWADSRRFDYAAATSAVRQAIVEAVKRAGIALPDPSVRNLAPRSPEAWKLLQGGSTEGK